MSTGRTGVDMNQKSQYGRIWNKTLRYARHEYRGKRTLLFLLSKIRHLTYSQGIKKLASVKNLNDNSGDKPGSTPTR